MVGLLPRTTLRVDRRSSPSPTFVSVQPSNARRIAGLLTGLGDTATDHLLNEGRIDAGLFDYAIEHSPKQLRGMETA